MRYGSWQTKELLDTWRTYVMGQGEWQASQYAGYYTKAVDITAYWRPTLKGLESKHYHDEADKALPAVVFGMVGRVGRVAGQRMATLCVPWLAPMAASRSQQRFLIGSKPGNILALNCGLSSGMTWYSKRISHPLRTKPSPW